VPQVYLDLDPAQIHHHRRDKPGEDLIKPFAQQNGLATKAD
jgi:hypothetical protein